MVLGLAAWSAVCAAVAVRAVWRGGRTLNDHVVAVFVVLCIVVYPLLGALCPGLPAPVAFDLSLGPFTLAALFVALDLRKEPPPWLTALARASQPAMAFSLWTGLLLGVRSPIALLLGDPLWPGAWLVLPAALAAWGTAWTWLGRRTRQNRVDLPHGGPRPLRIAHLSDLHASPLMTGADLAAVVTEVNRLAPDLVMITGDHVMPFSEARHPELLAAIRAIRAPVYTCNGNHDLPIDERLRAEFRAVGATPLVDGRAVVLVEGWIVEVVGVQFHWREAKRHVLEALGAQKPVPADARVLLAHDPRLWPWLPPGRFDLTLSGHTHGGQVALDMFGLRGSILRLFGAKDQGRFDGAQGALWVHRGNWHTGLPPRMGVAPEIVVHELVRRPAG